MNCPSCGYETFHPKAVNCDLCAAPLHPEGSGPPASSSGPQGELEAMADLVAEVAGETAPEPGKPAPAKSALAVAAPVTPAAIAPTFAAAAQATNLGPVDLLLYVLSLPVTWPVAAWGLVGGSTRAIATWIWITVSLLFLGAGVAVALSEGGTQIMYLPLAISASVICGGLLLMRQGEPKPAAWVIVVALLGGLGPLAISHAPGGLADEFNGGHRDQVRCLAIASDGSVLVSGGSDRQAIVWEAASGLPLLHLSAHKKALSAVAVANEAGLAVTAGWDGQVITWDLATGEARSQFAIASDRGVAAMVLTPKGDTVVLGTPAGVVLSSPLATYEPTELGLHETGVSALAIGADGKRLASAASDGSISVWDLGDNSLVFELPEAHAKTIRALAFAADGRLISGSYDRTIKVWDTAGELVQTFKISSPVRALAVRGDQAVATHSDRTVTLWDLKQLQRVGTYKLRTGRNPPSAVIFAPSGVAVVVADDTHVRPISLARFAQ